MKLKRPDTLFAGFAVALALLGGVAWFGGRHITCMQAATALVAHTERERDAWARLVLLIERVQGEQRGYLLTGEPAFLKLFEDAFKSVEEQRRLLEQKAMDAEQKANLAVLKPLLAERMAFARRNVDRRQNTGFEAAVQELLSLKGRNLTDQIDAQVARIDARSQVLLDQRAAQAGREAIILFLLGGTGTGLSFALLITVFALVLRENRLRQRAEAQLRDLFDGTSDIIQSVAPDGRLLFVNRAWHETLGYSKDDLAALIIFDIIHADYRDQCRGIFQRLMAGEDVGLIEVAFRAKDGRAVAVEGRVTVRFEGGAPVATRGIFRDLTARTQAEADRERLAQFERLAELMKGANDIILLADAHGRILEANDRAVETYGYSLAELRQKTVADLRTPASRAAFAQHMEQLETDGRAVFEAVHQRRDGVAFPVEISARFLQIAGVRYRMGIVRDITARKRAEQELRESKQHFERVVKNINDALIIDDVAGRVVYANQKFFQLFGLPEPELHSLKLEDYVAPEWRKTVRDRHDQRVRGEAVPEHFECEGLRGDGTRLWLEVSVVIVSERGRIVGTQAAIRDITARKRVETALLNSEARLAEAQRIAHLGSWEWDAATNTAIWSKELCAIMEVDPARPVPPGTELHKLYTPESTQRLHAAIEQAMRTVTPYEIELERVRENGTRQWLLARGEPVFNEQRQMTGLRGSALDITERKQAERALLAQGKRFRSLIENSTDIISLLSPEGGLKHLSPAFGELLGFAPADWLDRSLFEVIWPEDHAAAEALFKESLESPGEVVAWQLRLRHKDGGWRWMEGTGTNLISDPMIGGIVINCHDITKRKQAEQGLTVAHHRASVLAQLGRELAEASTPRAAALSMLQAARQLMDWDASWFHLWNEAQQQLDPVVNFDLVDGQRCEVSPTSRTWREASPMVRRVMQDGPQLLLRKSETDEVNGFEVFGNGRRSLSLLFVPLRFAGRFIGVLSIQSYQRQAYDPAALELLQTLADHCVGALARIQAAAALHASETRYRTLAESAQDIIYVINREFRLEYINEYGARKFGRSVPEVTGRQLTELFPPETTQWQLPDMAGIFRTGEPLHRERQLPFDQRSVWLDSQLVPLKNAAGEVESILGISRDITGRKQAEQALRWRETELRAILEATADGILAVDNHGKVIRSNRRFAELWRIPQALLETGHDQVLLDFVQDQLSDPDAFLKKVRLLYSSDAMDLETLVFKDGRIFERFSKPLLLEGVILGRVWSFRDVTDSQQAQRERQELLRQVVAAHEEERHRVATELHDQLGQKLAALALELKALEGGLTPDAARTKLHGLQQLAGRLMDQVHAIAWDLRPPVLDDLGLAIALHRYVTEWSERCDVPATFDSPGWGDLRLAPGTETAFYRVAQEALSNTRKHAQATRVHILLQRRPNEVLLVVEDNGQGFDLAAVEHTGNARRRLGLLGMQERMALLGGTLKIESAPGAGTMVFASAPAA